MNRLGVIGWPVAHSRSPAIQNAALAAAGLGDTWRYQLLPLPPEVFAETVTALPAAGFRGVNVTIPHKAVALRLATAASDRAAAIGAANTLVFEGNGEIRADNTDAPALIEALGTRLEVAGATALVLGAGGSARAAVWALLQARAQVRVWNRTQARAVELCHDLGGTPVSDIAGADVLVNCTAVGLGARDTVAMLPLPAAGLGAFEVVADLAYSEGGAALTRAARTAAVATIDGLEILVAQGALAFELFTGVPAPVEAMRRAVALSSAP